MPPAVPRPGTPEGRKPEAWPRPLPLPPAVAAATRALQAHAWRQVWSAGQPSAVARQAAAQGTIPLALTARSAHDCKHGLPEATLSVSAALSARLLAMDGSAAGCGGGCTAAAALPAASSRGSACTCWAAEGFPFAPCCPCRASPGVDAGTMLPCCCVDSSAAAVGRAATAAPPDSPAPSHCEEGSAASGASTANAAASALLFALALAFCFFFLLELPPLDFCLVSLSCWLQQSRRRRAQAKHAVLGTQDWAHKARSTRKRRVQKLAGRHSSVQHAAGSGSGMNATSPQPPLMLTILPPPAAPPSQHQPAPAQPPDRLQRAKQVAGLGVFSVSCKA